MKKIIVPTDFSIQAENALRVAADMARENDGEIFLLHLLDLPLHLANNASSNLPEALFFMKLAKEKFDNLTSSDFLHGVTVHGDVETGATFSGIMDTVKRHNADLIVMGSHGTGGVKNMFVGSNAEKIVRNSEVPVLIVKERKKNLDVNNMVFATDLDPESAGALKQASEFAKKTKCKLHLLYVNTPSKFLPSKKAEAMVQQYLKNIDVEPTDYAIYNDYSIEEGVFNYTQDIQGDIIAVANHGPKGLSHFFNGSVSDDIVNHSALPVVTFRIK
ncbi:MAG: universal stress protein [Nonlabens sp.]|nr:universal stress protein [Nonlabens sp.]